MTAASGRTTGNVPIEAIDPGGTHKAPSGDATKAGPSAKTRPEVQSGDRNEAPNKDIHDSDTNPTKP